MRNFNYRVVLASIALLACARSTPAAPETKPEMVLQLGHSGPINSLSWSPDGKTLASTGSGSSVKLWDVRNPVSPVLRRTLPFEKEIDGEIESVAFSSDGRWIAAGSRGVRVWDARDGRVMHDIHLQDGNMIFALAFAPGTSTLALAEGNMNLENQVSFWNALQGKRTRILTEEVGSISSIAFSIDGKMLAVSHWSNPENDNDPMQSAVDLWDVEQGILSRRITFRDSVDALAWSPNGKTIATGITDHAGSITVWDTRTGQQRQVVRDKFGASSLAFSPDGKWLAASATEMDGKSLVRVFEAASGVLNRTFVGKADHANGLVFSPDSRVLAAPGDGLLASALFLWNIETGKQMSSMLGHNRYASAIALSPNGQSATVNYQADGTRQWDLKTGVLKNIWGRPPAEQTSVVSYSPSGRLVAFDSSNQESGSTIQIRNLKSGALQRIANGATALSWSPDEELLLVCAVDEILLYNVRTGKLFKRLADQSSVGVDNWYLRTAYARDGKSVAVAGETERDGELLQTIWIWDVETGKLIKKWTAHRHQIGLLSFAPDGALLSGDDQEIKWWNAREGTLGRALKVRWPDAISPNGKIVTSTVFNAQRSRYDVHLIDVRNGKALGVLPGSLEGALIWEVAFSHDGKRIIAISGGHALVWDVRSARLLVTLAVLPDTDPNRVSNQWIAFTPEGFYTGSPNCEKFIRWRVGAKLFPAEKFKVEFHRPDLVAQALSP